MATSLATSKAPVQAAELELAQRALSGADAAHLAELAERVLLEPSAHSADTPSMFITDPDGLILWVNAAFTQLTGYTPAQAVGRNARLLSSGEQGRRFYRRMWECIRSGQVWTAETVDCDRYGFRYVIEQRIFPLMRDGVITHYLSVHREAAEQRVQRLEAQRRRVIDPSTGLLTATAFLDRIGDRVRQAETANRHFAVISLQLSPQQLDVATCARALQAALGRADCAGHFGDGHIGLLINDQDSAAAVCAWLGQLLAPLCQRCAWQAGVAIYPLHAERADRLWRIADDNVP